MKLNYYYVYILECSDRSFYTGVTNNVNRRFQEHNDGCNVNCYTFDKRPVTLLYATHFIYFEQAVGWEKKLKGWSRKKKIALIKERWDDLSEFSKCLNGSSHVFYKKP